MRDNSLIGQDIYDQGGRSFWIHNTGPVGCLPYVMDRVPITAGQVDKYGCADPFNEVAKYFNLKLKEMVQKLRQELPEAAITYVDVYSVKYTLITKAKKFGKSCFDTIYYSIYNSNVKVKFTWISQNILSLSSNLIQLI